MLILLKSFANSVVERYRNLTFALPQAGRMLRDRRKKKEKQDMGNYAAEEFSCPVKVDRGGLNFGLRKS